MSNLTFQEAIQEAQLVRSLANTVEMLELQINQLPATVTERGELFAQAVAMASLLDTAANRAEQVKAAVRIKLTNND